MNSVPARVEVENSTSSSSGFRIVCQGLKRLSGASPHENIHYRDDKSTVPSLVSDDIFRQLKELSRTELKDLCSEMSIFKNELRENKIRDARGILWFKLRNRYNINPNGTERLKKNPQNEYPKFKKSAKKFMQNLKMMPLQKKNNTHKLHFHLKTINLHGGRTGVIQSTI